jgi:hypothetical protein
MGRQFYRLTLGVFDNACFLSHKDEMKVVERALRRADLKLTFTQGFSPKPVFSFGPARPTGYGSLSDYLDISLEESLDEQVLKKKINAVLPDGFFLYEVKKIAEAEFGNLSKLFIASILGVVIKSGAAVDLWLEKLNECFGGYGKFFYDPQREHLFYERLGLAQENDKIFQKKRGLLITFNTLTTDMPVFRLDKLLLDDKVCKFERKAIDRIFIIEYQLQY